MALKLRIAELMKDKDINITSLSKRAGIAYKTALELKKGNARRVDLDTLEKVCLALNVTPADLFEYIPPKK